MMVLGCDPMKIDEKRCSKCGEMKNHSYFFKDRSKQDNLCSSCKTCSLETAKKWESKNQERAKSNREKWKKAHPDKIREYVKRGDAKRRSDPIRMDNQRRYHKEHVIKLRKDVLFHYGGVCACCGESTYEFLSLDHIYGGGNKQKRELGKRGPNFYRWLKVNGYPEGYRVLCHNCNQALGAYGYCPHKEGSICHMTKQF